MLALVVAGVSFVLAAGAVFLFFPGGGEERGAPPRRAAAPPAKESQERTIGALPAPCGTVAAGTVQGLIPRAQRRESSNQTLTTCTYTSGGDGFRWLRVEAYLYAPGNTATPVEDARRYFGAQWTQADNATLERTVSLARHPGMGDEAFRVFKADRGQPTVVGQVTVRERNVVVTVSYSEQTRGRAEDREQDCLNRATRVAGEVLRGFR
ncbi:hypothetical protein GCM10010191_56010 [Actinomadura vinacea]|uniref:DUF3558 domain-containing protein n=1 Tax=Actinomadura vinacea TaxID=115336 RepID=A0ABP5WV82_9ACTN